MRFLNTSLDWMAFFTDATPLIWLACLIATAVAMVLLLCILLELWRELSHPAQS